MIQVKVAEMDVLAEDKFGEPSWDLNDGLGGSNWVCMRSSYGHPHSVDTGTSEMIPFKELSLLRMAASSKGPVSNGFAFAAFLRTIG